MAAIISDNRISNLFYGQDCVISLIGNQASRVKKFIEKNDYVGLSYQAIAISKNIDLYLYTFEVIQQLEKTFKIKQLISDLYTTPSSSLEITRRWIGETMEKMPSFALNMVASVPYYVTNFVLSRLLSQEQKAYCQIALALTKFAYSYYHKDKTTSENLIHDFLRVCFEVVDLYSDFYALDVFSFLKHFVSASLKGIEIHQLLSDGKPKSLQFFIKLGNFTIHFLASLCLGCHFYRKTSGFEGIYDYMSMSRCSVDDIRNLIEQKRTEIPAENKATPLNIQEVDKKTLQNEGLQTDEYQEQKTSKEIIEKRKISFIKDEDVPRITEIPAEKKATPLNIQGVDKKTLRNEHLQTDEYQEQKTSKGINVRITLSYEDLRKQGIFPYLYGIDFTGEKFSFENLKVTGLTIVRSHFYDYNCNNSEFSHMNFRRCSGRLTALNSIWDDVTLRECSFLGLDQSGSVLKNSSWIDSIIYGWNLGNASLDSFSIENSCIQEILSPYSVWHLVEIKNSVFYQWDNSFSIMSKVNLDSTLMLQPVFVDTKIFQTVIKDSVSTLGVFFLEKVSSSEIPAEKKATSLNIKGFDKKTLRNEDLRTDEYQEQKTSKGITVSSLCILNSDFRNNILQGNVDYDSRSFQPREGLSLSLSVISKPGFAYVDAEKVFPGVSLIPFDALNCLELLNKKAFENASVDAIPFAVAPQLLSLPKDFQENPDFKGVDLESLQNLIEDENGSLKGFKESFLRYLEISSEVVFRGDRFKVDSQDVLDLTENLSLPEVSLEEKSVWLFYRAAQLMSLHYAQEHKLPIQASRLGLRVIQNLTSLYQDIDPKTSPVSFSHEMPQEVSDAHVFTIDQKDLIFSCDEKVLERFKLHPLFAEARYMEGSKINPDREKIEKQETYLSAFFGLFKQQPEFSFKVTIGGDTYELNGKHSGGVATACGGFGRVFFGYNVADPTRKIAVKLTTVFENEKESILDEALLGLKIQNAPYLVGAHQVGVLRHQSQNLLFIVMDEFPGRDFESSFKTTSILSRLKILITSSLGVLNLHRLGYIHRDIKLSNVLVKNGSGFLGDFGFAVKEDKKITEGVGTIVFMSPECWKDELQSYTSDVYSFGLMLHQALTGKILGLEGNNWRGRLERIRMQDIVVPERNFRVTPYSFLPEFMRNDFKNLVERCLKVDPKDRISSETLTADLEFIFKRYEDHCKITHTLNS